MNFLKAAVVVVFYLSLAYGVDDDLDVEALNEGDGNTIQLLNSSYIKGNTRNAAFYFEQYSLKF